MGRRWNEGAVAGDGGEVGAGRSALLYFARLGAQGIHCGAALAAVSDIGNDLTSVMSGWKPCALHWSVFGWDAPPRASSW